jgi:hypothetical protein
MSNTLKLGNGKWATGKDNLLAYNDENNNFKPLPFSFSRASNATVVNEQGLIELVGSDEPRIDFKDDAKGSLLLEPTRSNVIPYSQDFENSDWTKNAGTTITNNYAISPDGTLNASRYLGTGASGLGDKFTLSAASYTLSFYVKSNTSENQFCVLLGDSSQSSGDLLVTTEWKRISYTFTGSGLSNKTNGIFRDSNNNDIDILIYGAQLEQGSYATSLINTQGSAVTRVADVCSQTPPSGIIGQTEGTAYVEIDWKENDEESIFSVLHDGTVNNRMDFGYSAVFNSFYFNVRTGGSAQGLMQYVSPTIGKYKVAISYKNNDFALWVNGVKEASDVSGSVPVTTQYNVGNYIGGGREHSIINSKLYNTALTDAELAILTTI